MSEPKQFISREKPINNRLLTGLAGLAMAALLVVIELRTNDEPEDASEVFIAGDTVIKPVDSVFARQRAADPTYPLPGFIAKQLPSGSPRHVQNELISRAASAVEDEDRIALAHVLALLGASALSENELNNARVYLNEALHVYEEENDSMGIGSVELLRSRVESVARENARDAASAYDVLQIGAWMITKHRFYEAEEPIVSAINENLRLNRYGAAAAGYEMLQRGFHSVGDTHSANEATKQALRLHAASGRVSKAHVLLEKLANSGTSGMEIDQLAAEIRTAEREYNDAIKAVASARDYEHLYRRLITAGDPVQAWMFRQKASQSLAQTSKRAMHRRQTGVIALLYNSNHNKKEARESLQRAREIFAAEARNDLVEHVDYIDQAIW